MFIGVGSLVWFGRLGGPALEQWVEFETRWAHMFGQWWRSLQGWLVWKDKQNGDAWLPICDDLGRFVAKGMKSKWRHGMLKTCTLNSGLGKHLRLKVPAVSVKVWGGHGPPNFKIINMPCQGFFLVFVKLRSYWTMVLCLSMLTIFSRFFCPTMDIYTFNDSSQSKRLIEWSADCLKFIWPFISNTITILEEGLQPNRVGRQINFPA